MGSVSSISDSGDWGVSGTKSPDKGVDATGYISCLKLFSSISYEIKVAGEANAPSGLKTPESSIITRFSISPICPSSVENTLYWFISPNNSEIPFAALLRLTCCSDKTARILLDSSNTWSIASRLQVFALPLVPIFTLTPTKVLDSQSIDLTFHIRFKSVLSYVLCNFTQLPSFSNCLSGSNFSSISPEFRNTSSYGITWRRFFFRLLSFRRLALSLPSCRISLTLVLTHSSDTPISAWVPNFLLWNSSAGANPKLQIDWLYIRTAQCIAYSISESLSLKATTRNFCSALILTSCAGITFFEHVVDSCTSSSTPAFSKHSFVFFEVCAEAPSVLQITFDFSEFKAHRTFLTWSTKLINISEVNDPSNFSATPNLDNPSVANRILTGPFRPWRWISSIYTTSPTLSGGLTSFIAKGFLTFSWRSRIQPVHCRKKLSIKVFAFANSKCLSNICRNWVGLLHPNSLCTADIATPAAGSGTNTTASLWDNFEIHLSYCNIPFFTYAFLVFTIVLSRIPCFWVFGGGTSPDSINFMAFRSTGSARCLDAI